MKNTKKSAKKPSRGGRGRLAIWRCYGLPGDSLAFSATIFRAFSIRLAGTPRDSRMSIPSARPLVRPLVRPLARPSARPLARPLARPSARPSALAFAQASAQAFSVPRRMPLAIIVSISSRVTMSFSCLVKSSSKKSLRALSLSKSSLNPVSYLGSR